MSKMRVIHLIGGGDTGGAKTHVLHLLRELNRSTPSLYASGAGSSQTTPSAWACPSL